MAAVYGFNLNTYASGIMDRFALKLFEYGIEQNQIASAVQRAKAESRKEFLEWTRRQAELLKENISDAAPKRSGNLSESLYLDADGDNWDVKIDERRAPYANIVLEGRGSITPRVAQFLVFPDTRLYNWRPMSNLARVTGANAAKYPHTGNLRTRHTIPRVGGAPAIDFPGEGFDRWQSFYLPSEVQQLREEIVSIVIKNGGQVTGLS